MKPFKTTFCYFYFLIFSITLFSCSQLIWRDSSLAPLFIPSDKEAKGLFLTLEYEERDSWNPLQGTSLKKNYKTRVSFLGGEPKEVVWDSWVLPEFVFYDSQKETVHFLMGTNDEYGLGPQKYYTFSLSLGVAKPLLSQDSFAKELSLSSQTQFVALLLYTLDSQGVESGFRVEIWKSGTRVSQKEINSWEPYPLSALRWVGDSLFLANKSNVEVWNEKEGWKPASSFPVCFRPSSPWGKVAYPEAQWKEIEARWSSPSQSPKPKMTNQIASIEACW